MSAIDSKTIAAGVLLVLTLVSGFVLGHSARPLSSALFTVHKLIAVAFVVLMVLAVKNHISGVAGGAAIPLAFIIMGIFVVFAAITGAASSPGLNVPKIYEKLIGISH